MKKLLIFISFALAGCAPHYPPHQQHLVGANQIANKQDMIELQNLTTRDIVICTRDGKRTAEECAKFFEDQGFVKLRNIPNKPARYDNLKTDTFPTRRWRDGENTPRW